MRKSLLRAAVTMITAGLVAGLAFTGQAAADEPAVQPFIVGGKTVTDQKPWIAALHGGGGFTCTSSVVAPTWVLTAAHCVEGSGYSVRVGSLDRSEGGTVVNVKRVVQHPQFNWPDHDIALLELERAVQTETLPLANDADMRDGQAVEIYGWGSEKADWTGPLPRRLKMASGTAYNCDEQAVHVTCTDADGGVAGGDSGGPALVKSAATGEWVHAGVCAIGHKPANDQWGGYSTTASYRSWIKQVAGI
ncbi:trypsin [Herbihabitans rhizosphaerae]|uniref:Trypsin n=1 Tax=Herbihabitans rhizosphaerae TaxID=1872711 RepID=A0A4Q7L1R3_9PSEU|nr:trypsin-like serine protease [Herbihabitans rhizosphaerae]RZS43105.1 trypsin [Herbihabitans rhizosphaerae]